MLKTFRTLFVCVTAVAVSPFVHAGPDAAPANAVRARIAPAKPDGGYRQEGYWVWCGSVVRGDDGLFHMYASRWPKSVLMHPGWMVASEIIHCVSETAEGPYRFSDVSLGARGAEYWDGRSQHNPRVFRHGDEYVLFYMGSTHPFEDAAKQPEKVTLDSAYCTVGRANKRIGVATSKSPYGPWTRSDRPVLDVKPGTFYSFLTSNPSPVIHEDGSVTMIFKSRRYKSTYPYHSDMFLGLAKAPHYKGPYTVIGDKPLFGHGDGFPEVEDPFLWKDEKGYHLLAKDHQGKATGTRGDGLLAHSPDALHWTVDPSPLAYDKFVRRTDGTVVKYGQMERPGGIFENGKLTHLTFAVMDGTGGFDAGQNTGVIVVPLKPEPAAK